MTPAAARTWRVVLVTGIFGAMHDRLRRLAAWFSHTVVLNVVGGLGLAIALRLVRSQELIEDHREAVRGRKG